jgi:hypothetical protein
MKREDRSPAERITRVDINDATRLPDPATLKNIEKQISASNGALDAIQRGWADAGRSGMLGEIGKSQARFAAFGAQFEADSKASQARDASIRALVESERAALQRAVDRAPHFAAVAGPTAAEIALRENAIRQISCDAARDLPNMRAAFEGWTVPKVGAILPPEPVMRYVEPPAIEYHSPGISNLDERVEALAGEVQALKEALTADNHGLAAENQRLTTENEALRGKIRYLKRRLDLPVFKNLQEYEGPELPPDETRFSTD